MKALDIDRVRTLLGMANAFTLAGDPVIDRRTLRGAERPQKQKAAVRRWNRQNRRRKKCASRKATDKAIIERRERNWIAGTWGSGGRSYRSGAQIVAHREAIRRAFEVSAVLTAADLRQIGGERRWRQDIKWMVDQGLCTVRIEQTGGKLNGKKRTFTRTAKPWIVWEPYAPKVRAYNAMERAACDYLE